LSLQVCPAFRCGKTTMARVLISRADVISKEVSATIASTNQVRSIFENARDELQLTGRFVIIRLRVRRLVVILCCRRTIVFLDEIHRFTRSQQVLDAFATVFIFFDIVPLSGCVYPFHRTGFCASKQHCDFMLFDSSHVDHRSDHREPVI
jgi:hypothetical protein